MIPAGFSHLQDKCMSTGVQITSFIIATALITVRIEYVQNLYDIIDSNESLQKNMLVLFVKI